MNRSFLTFPFGGLFSGYIQFIVDWKQTPWKQLKLFQIKRKTKKCHFCEKRKLKCVCPTCQLYCTFLLEINLYFCEQKSILRFPFWPNIKQWPLAPNSRKWRITRANVSNASHIFPEMTFGECRQVWRVRHGILANLANLANF